MTFEKLESSKIKSKYFRRTEKWDWLSEEMIHVFDSKSPRVITMDPWPQKIFLEALGQLTVSEYIYTVSKEYPKNQTPKELDEVILEMLDSLINEEKIITLSDEPISLEKSILNPLTEKGEINMEGIWNGSYQYNLPDELKDEKLKDVNFTLTIEKVKGKTFNGTVKDDLTTGGTPGIGVIKGEIRKNGVEFNKKMPISATIEENWERVINEKKKHPTIIYEGNFSRGKKNITGTWRFKKKVLFWKGVIPYWVSLGNGSFIMSKEENN
jgi:hypothetical protein